MVETNQIYKEHPNHPTRGDTEFLLPDVANTVARNCEVDWAATEGGPGWNIAEHMGGREIFGTKYPSSGSSELTK